MSMDVRIDGFGTITEGEYDRIKIDGMGKINGNIKCHMQRAVLRRSKWM